MKASFTHRLVRAFTRPARRSHLPGLLAAALAVHGAACGNTVSDETLALVRAAEDQRVRVMDQAARSVVSIFDSNRGGGGSGVIISADGLGLTNFHVIADMMPTRRGLGGLSDGKLYPLEVLGIDPTGDLAMFRLSGRDSFDPAPLGNSDNVRVGDDVFAMGNPFLLAEDYSPTVTYGIVSGVNRYQFGADGRTLVYTDCIQVDASINPGNSGGPLFNMGGEVIGINGRASFEQRGRINVGLGYAISINQVKRFVPALRAGLLTEHGTLGATVIDLGYRRVVFERMLEPSIATAAGIAIGDRLVAFGGREIHTANQFGNILGTYPASWPVTVTFEHEGRMLSRTVRLERLPVRLRAPVPTDQKLNRAQTQRVLEAARAFIGHLAPETTLVREGQRVEMQYGAGGRTAGVRFFRSVEPADGEVQLSFPIVGEGAATSRPYAEGSEVESRSAAMLKLWTTTRRALYGGDTALERWRHVGGDEAAGEILDVVECSPPDGPELRISIDPQTHRPVRAWWKPSGSPDAKNPPLELELGDFREVGGARLPHRLRATLFGEDVIIDRIDRYATEGTP